MNINILAIDIAKTVFQLCGVDRSGNIVKELRISRNKLLKTIEKLQPKIVAMEACGSANYWAREFSKLSIEVKLIAPQYVKPFVKGQKNDKQDARGIAEACQRPTMSFVSPKTIPQQDMQSLLRVREGYIAMQTKVCNQLRGLLAEYGITIPQAKKRLRKILPTIFDRDATNGLTGQMKSLIEMQYSMLLVIDENIDVCDMDIEKIAKENEVCQRLQAIEGVGPITAVAVVSLAGNGTTFKNGRHFAAYLGLVPRQHSSGMKQKLQGITKHGDNYVRQLLVHGGRSITTIADKKETPRNEWLLRLKQERGFNKAAVALANKNARIMLAMIKSGEPYRQAA
jgi:transposase